MSEDAWDKTNASVIAAHLRAASTGIQRSMLDRIPDDELVACVIRKDDGGYRWDNDLLIAAMQRAIKDRIEALDGTTATELEPPK